MTDAGSAWLAAAPDHETATVAETLEQYIGRRASALQRAYQADEATAVATLARLRRIDPAGGDLSPDSWDIFDGMPAALLGRGDEPSAAEYAAVAALALFATHQQSRRDAAMHVPGPVHSLGRAVGRLAQAAGGQGAERRFRALTRAADISAAVQHLRGLIGLLRAQRIPLDYAALARDLYRFQYNSGVHGVRMRWIRDFHRSASDTRTPTAQTGEQP